MWVDLEKKFKTWHVVPFFGDLSWPWIIMRSFLLTSLPLKYSEPHIKIFRIVFELINNLSFAFKHKWWNFLNGLSVEDIYQNKVVVYPHSLFLKQKTLAHYLNIPHSNISVIIFKPWKSFCRLFAEQKTVSQSHTLFTKSSQHIKPTNHSTFKKYLVATNSNLTWLLRQVQWTWNKLL